jgi:diacylglycerol kinase (ATP)
LNEFSSRQRDGQPAEGNRGGGRNDGGRNDGNRNRNQATGNNAARSQDGRGRDGDARRNGNNRNGQGQRPGGTGAAKKSTGRGWKSLRFALNGVKTGYWNEAHLAVHTLAAILALVAAWYLNIPPAHTAAVLLAIGGVMAAEFFNTALETLADALQPRPHGGIGKAKDLAAAGVLMAVLVAIGVGVVVFGPALWTLVSGWM